MSPTARHLAAAQLRGRTERLRTPVPVTASFALSVHRPPRPGQ
ncbi:hypothetical protein ACFUKV_17690 [Streptomyces paradoxus]